VKFASFDLEIAKVLPADVTDLKAHAPLGIACAAVALSDRPEPVFWQGTPQLSAAEAGALVRDLQALVADGYTLLTWNGCNFDFWVLAQESGLLHECGALALDHVDLMLIVTFTKGHFLGLERALKGAGLAGKKHVVKLNDGSVLTEMSGALAPALWAKGERQAVLEYLADDVTMPLKLAEVVARRKEIRWTSGGGKPQSCPVPQLYSVRECFWLPKPDTAWMSEPPKREQFVEWIPGWQAEIIRPPRRSETGGGAGSATRGDGGQVAYATAAAETAQGAQTTQPAPRVMELLPALLAAVAVFGLALLLLSLWLPERQWAAFAVALAAGAAVLLIALARWRAR
jgi:hypothetical protein